MEKTGNRKAFTLVELLVALILVGILLSAVAAVAYALDNATAVGEDVTVKQAQLRHTTLHILDLVRTCRMICAAPGNDLVLWKADENGDGRINVNELVYIEAGDNLDKLQLCCFDSSADEVAFGSLALSTTKADLIAAYDPAYKTLLPDCSNVAFTVDSTPPWTNTLTVGFDLTEEGRVCRYEISATLCAWAGHLLDDSGALVTTGDDDE